MIRVMYVLSLGGVACLLAATKPIALVSGIILLALNFGLARTITFALVGDLAEPGRIESLSALYWMVQSFATMSALLLSTFWRGPELYWASLALIGLTYLFLRSPLKLGLPALRAAINTEMTSM